VSGNGISLAICKYAPGPNLQLRLVPQGVMSLPSALIHLPTSQVATFGDPDPGQIQRESQSCGWRG